MINKWDNIKTCIKEAKTIVIFTHNNMDGDALGSSLALCFALKQLGKDVCILLEDNIPKYLSFLNTSPELFTFIAPSSIDLAIAVDCGDESRVEKRIEAFSCAKNRICIDHHMQKEGFAEFSVVEPNIAASGLLIYELLLDLNIQFTKDIASLLYAAILTDTGRFMYSNTTSLVHQVIAKLLEYDIDYVDINNHIYASYPIEQIKLESKAIENMQVIANGKAVVSYITKDELKELNAPYEFVDTCIDRIRVLEGTEIACMIKQKEDGSLKASLRSKSYANVNAIAANLGGGGHYNASGCSYDGDLQHFKNLLINEIEKALS